MSTPEQSHQTRERVNTVFNKGPALGNKSQKKVAHSCIKPQDDANCESKENVIFFALT